MRFIRLLLAFLLALILFWISPRLPELKSESRFYDASVAEFLVDHTAVGRHTTESHPEISARVTTPVDTSEFRLSIKYRREDGDSLSSMLMPRVEGTFDLYAVTIPLLERGSSYNYFLELQQPDGSLIARLPEDDSILLRLFFRGKPDDLLVTVHSALIFLGAMFALLALFDALVLRSDEMRLKKLSQKVVTATIFFLVGGIIAEGVLFQNLYGCVWAGWPFGNNLSHTMLEILTLYWFFLTSIFKGTIFGFRPEKNLVSAGGASLLTLLGVLLMIATYLQGQSV